jgi:hypothetical protein
MADSWKPKNRGCTGTMGKLVSAALIRPIPRQIDFLLGKSRGALADAALPLASFCRTRAYNLKKICLGLFKIPFQINDLDKMPIETRQKP